MRCDVSGEALKTHFLQHLSSFLNTVPFGIMKRTLLFLLLTLAANMVFAQDNTRNFYYDLNSGVKARVAVVPFEPRMLISDLHREMCKRNGMTTREVREALAEGFFYAMRRQAPALTETDVFGWRDPWPKPLETIYQSIGYQYRPLPSLAGQAAEVHGSFVESGEIRQKNDTITRFIHATVDTALVADLASDADVNYILMVSQLDIVNLGTPLQVNPDGAAFYVRLHYALYNADGSERSAGIVRRPLTATTYEPVAFAKSQFSEAARALYDALTLDVRTEEAPPPEGENPTSR